MAYKVTNMKEIDYIHMTDEERKKIWRLNDLYLEWGCTSFDTESDYYALYVDLDFHDGDDDDADRQYAVYLKESGKLLCLLVDAASALEGYTDVDYGMKRNELYKQLAMVAGWPEKLPPKQAYVVTLIRSICVKVYADSSLQAKKIGEVLASGTSDLACEITNNAMCNGDDMLWSVSRAVNDDGFCHARLTEEECEQFLNEED